MKLSVRVVSGTDLSKQKRRKKAAPLHCRLKLSGKPSFKTLQEVPASLAGVNGTTLPPSVEWDETFMYNKMSSAALSNFPLHVTLVRGRKDVVGEALVSLADFADGAPRDKWFQTTRKAQFTGKIRLVIQCSGAGIVAPLAADQEQVGATHNSAAASAQRADAYVEDVEEAYAEEAYAEEAHAEEAYAEEAYAEEAYAAEDCVEYGDEAKAAAPAPAPVQMVGYGYDGKSGAGAPGYKTGKPSIFTIAAIDVARSRVARKATSYGRAALKKLDAAIRVSTEVDAHDADDAADLVEEAEEHYGAANEAEAYGASGAYVSDVHAAYDGEYANVPAEDVATATAVAAPTNVNAGLTGLAVHTASGEEGNAAGSPGGAASSAPIDDASIAAAVSRIFETDDGTNALGLSPVYTAGVRKWERKLMGTAPAVAAAQHALKYAAPSAIGSPALDGRGNAMPTKRSSLRRTLLLRASAKDSRKVTPMKAFPGVNSGGGAENLTPEEKADAAEAERCSRLSVALTDDDVLPWKTGGMCGYLKKLSCTKSSSTAYASAAAARMAASGAGAENYGATESWETGEGGASSIAGVLAESADPTLGSIAAYGKKVAGRKLKISRTRWQKRFFAVRLSRCARASLCTRRSRLTSLPSRAPSSPPPPRLVHTAAHHRDSIRPSVVILSARDAVYRSETTTSTTTSPPTLSSDRAAWAARRRTERGSSSHRSTSAPSKSSRAMARSLGSVFPADASTFSPRRAMRRHCSGST